MVSPPPLLVAVALAALALPAGATDGTFTSPGGGAWSDSANWQNATVGGGAGSVVSLCAPLSGNATVSLDADTTVGDLSVEDTNGGHTWTLSGATLAFDSGNGSPSGVNVANGTTLSVSAITNANAVVKTGAGQWMIAPAANGATFTENALVIREGTVYFSNNNYSGTKITLDSSDGSSPVLRFVGAERKNGPTISVPAGTGSPVISYSPAGKINSGTLVLSRMVEVNLSTAANATLFGGGMTGTGGIRKTGSGTFVMGAAPAFDGEIIVSEGTVSCGSSTWKNTVNIAVTIGDESSSESAALGWNFSEKTPLPGASTSFHVTTNGGPVKFSWHKPQNGATCRSAFVLDRDMTFHANLNSGNGNTFAGVFSGVGGIAFTGKYPANHFTLSGENTYSGGTSIDSVTVKASANSVLGTGNVSIGATGILEYAADVGNVIADSATLSLATGAVVAFGDHAVTEKVAALFIDGQRQPSGLYGAPGSGAEHETSLITGSGFLHAAVDSATLILFRGPREGESGNEGENGGEGGNEGGNGDGSGDDGGGEPPSETVNLIPEGKRDAVVPFKGEGQTGMVYTPVFFPADTEALVFTCEIRTEGVVAGSESWYNARFMTDFIDADYQKVKGGPAIGGWTGTRDWTSVRKVIEVPAGASGIALMPALFNVTAGAFEVRNMCLEPVSGIDAALDGVPRSETLPVKTAWTTAPLQVHSNRLVNASTGAEVWLQGVAVPSMEWSPGGEHILQSVTNLVEEWNVNVVRLAVHSSYWFGRGKNQNPRTGIATYRGLVDKVADYLQSRGKYLVLDLHEYRAPKASHAAFWLDAATRYKNHPGVIFGLLNEPHDVSWDIWRNGGVVVESGSTVGDRTVGMQGLVDAVRSTGAGNLVTAGGLDWGYTHSGVLAGYALDDANLMYESHVYPWKSGWKQAFLDVAERYPVLLGEVGAQDTPMDFETEESFVPPEEWVPDILGVIQDRRLNWTAWCFHPKSSPCLITGWDYTPTSYWGVPAKRALSGDPFPAPAHLR